MKPKTNDKKSVLEDMEKLKQRREERKNKQDRQDFIKTDDYINLIKKKKQGLNLEKEEVNY